MLIYGQTVVREKYIYNDQCFGTKCQNYINIYNIIIYMFWHYVYYHDWDSLKKIQSLSISNMNCTLELFDKDIVSNPPTFLKTSTSSQKIINFFETFGNLFYLCSVIHAKCGF